MSAAKAKLWAVVPAAGVGSRMGAAVPKQFLLLDGTALLVRSVQALLRYDAIDEVVVVIAPADVRSRAILAPLFEQPAFANRLKLCNQGGATRAQTVTAGLASLNSAQLTDWVLVHDAARPGLSQAALQRLITAVIDKDIGGILALPVPDTVKQVVNTEGLYSVARTIDRQTLWLAQTPQMFRVGELAGALAQAHNAQLPITDEASAMEAAGYGVQIIPGERGNLKVTLPDDLPILEALFKGRD
jgi:2-C-methyl-D-erythritol 4-phosphate cytidylyltransferase